MKALLRLLIIYVLILSTTVSGETNPETLTPHQTVQVLLQGNDSGKLRQALLDLGGKITHDLPIVSGIGGVVGATELAKLAAMDAGTVVIVSHSFGMLSEVCDRLVLLEKGSIISEGEPKDVIEAYYENIKPKKG